MSKVASRRFPASERLRTLDLYFQLANTNDVGAALGISGASVRSRLKTMDVAMMRRGVLGQSPESVNDADAIQRLRSRLETEASRERDRDTAPVDAVDIRALYRRGWTAQRIAAELGISTTSVLRVVKKAGLSRPRGPMRSVESSVSVLARASLDAPLDQWGTTLAEITPDARYAVDPQRVVEQQLLDEIVGGLQPDDVASLDEHRLSLLRRRVLEAGFAPPAVQAKERERLRGTVPHRGEAPAEMWRRMSPSRRNRKQRIASRKSGEHTSRKQPKGWRRAA